MAKSQSSRLTAVILWIAGILLLLAVAFSIRHLTRSTVAVHTTNASYQTLTSTVATNGKVEPVGEFQAHAPLPGVIKKIFVDVGDHVSVGTLLLDMDATDARKQLTGAQANVASAVSSLNDLQQGGSTEERGRFSSDIASARAEQQTAQNNLRVEQTLQSKGAASVGEVASAQARLDTANLSLRNASARTSGRYSSGELAAAQARVVDARAGVAAAQSSLSAVSIRSPQAGTVYSIPVAEYDYVPAGDDLLDVADLSKIQVRAYFDEPDVGKLAAGQRVRIVWEAKPGVVWHGHIEQPPTTIINYQNTRNVGECIIAIDDARGDLLPNTNVTVTVTELERPNVLSIPREALHTTQGPANYVFRVVNGKLVRTPVQIGIFNNTSVEITSGLTPRDVVVLGPAEAGKDLIDGMEVKP